MLGDFYGSTMHGRPDIDFLGLFVHLVCYSVLLYILVIPA